MSDNPCFCCGCYDPDMGCSMPSTDKWYACKEYDNSRELAVILYAMCHDMDFHDYDDTEKESIRKLADDIRKAREIGLDSLCNALEIICIHN